MYYITIAGNSVSTQLVSSCQGNRYSLKKAGGTARPLFTKSHLLGHSPPASQAGRRVGPALKPSVSLLQTMQEIVEKEKEQAVIKYVVTDQLGNMVLMLLLSTPLNSSEGYTVLTSY
jgi:hypothetical protein